MLRWHVPESPGPQPRAIVQMCCTTLFARWCCIGREYFSEKTLHPLIRSDPRMNQRAIEYSADTIGPISDKRKNKPITGASQLCLLCVPPMPFFLLPRPRSMLLLPSALPSLLPADICIRTIWLPRAATARTNLPRLAVRTHRHPGEQKARCVWVRLCFFVLLLLSLCEMV